MEYLVTGLRHAKVAYCHWIFHAGKRLEYLYQRVVVHGIYKEHTLVVRLFLSAGCLTSRKTHYNALNYIKRFITSYCDFQLI